MNRELSNTNLVIEIAFKSLLEKMSFIEGKIFPNRSTDLNLECIQKRLCDFFQEKPSFNRLSIEIPYVYTLECIFSRSLDQNALQVLKQKFDIFFSELKNEGFQENVG